MRRYFDLPGEGLGGAQVAVLRHGVGGALAAVRQLRVLSLEVFADRFQGVASDGDMQPRRAPSTQSRMPPDSAAIIQPGATVTSAAEAAGNVSDPTATAAALQTTVRATAGDC